jgi:hypothetical protein
LIESVIPEARPLHALVTALSIAAFSVPDAAVRQTVSPLKVMQTRHSWWAMRVLR